MTRYEFMRRRIPSMAPAKVEMHTWEAACCGLDLRALGMGMGHGGGTYILNESCMESEGFAADRKMIFYM